MKPECSVHHSDACRLPGLQLPPRRDSSKSSQNFGHCGIVVSFISKDTYHSIHSPTSSRRFIGSVSSDNQSATRNELHTTRPESDSLHQTPEPPHQLSAVQFVACRFYRSLRREAEPAVRRSGPLITSAMGMFRSTMKPELQQPAFCFFRRN